MVAAGTDGIGDFRRRVRADAGDNLDAAHAMMFRPSAGGGVGKAPAYDPICFGDLGPSAFRPPTSADRENSCPEQ
ncbi:hypothetical protein GCM10023085_61020 [Actinomadura viridis]